MAARNLKEVTKHYLIAALWSSTECDEQGNNCAELDNNHDLDDVSPELLKSAEEDCAAFIAETELIDTSWWTDGQFGHDFWLTRAHHGAGFWDRGQGATGETLTRLAQIHANIDLYVGDDGLIYGG